MKIKCEQFKPVNKSGKTEKCFCKYLNRHEAREAKMYKQFIKTLERPKHAAK